MEVELAALRTGKSLDPQPCKGRITAQEIADMKKEAKALLAVERKNTKKRPREQEPEPGLSERAAQRDAERAAAAVEAEETFHVHAELSQAAQRKAAAKQSEAEMTAAKAKTLKVKPTPKPKKGVKPKAANLKSALDDCFSEEDEPREFWLTSD